MIPSQFDYIAAQSVEQATRLLEQTQGAKILAGGMSLLPAVKARLNEPGLLIDIGKLDELVGVSTGWLGRLKIGAMSTHVSLIDHPDLTAQPIFSDAARVIADVQVRNRGTIGGSLSYADPAADWPAVFLALEGEVLLRSHKKKRKVKAEDFFLSMMTSAVASNELLTEVAFSLDSKRAGNAYIKHRQPASGLALAGAAVNLVVDKKQRIEKINMGVSGVNAMPFLARSLSEKLQGGVLPSEDALQKLCAQVDECDPLEDLHGGADYRRALLANAASRSISLAYQRATAA